MSQKDFRIKFSKTKTLGERCGGNFTHFGNFIWVNSNQNAEYKIIVLIHELGHCVHYHSDKDNYLGREISGETPEDFDIAYLKFLEEREFFAFKYTYTYLLSKKWKNKKKLLRRFKKIMNTFANNDKRKTKLGSRSYTCYYALASRRIVELF